MASRTKIFFKNSLSLCISALIMRGIGVVFNIYVSRTAGNVAMGLYSLILGVYGFFITIACCGINLGVTRLVSESLGKNDIPLAKRAMRTSLAVCASSSICAMLILIFAAPFISEKILLDARCTLSLRVMALSLPPLAICSCMSGYFYAVRRVRASSAVMTLMQIAKIFITVALLKLLTPYGEEYACLALVGGVTVCEMLCLASNIFLYALDRKKLKGSSCPSDAPQKTLGALLSITLPVTVASCARSLLSSLSHALIPRGLKRHGSSWSAALSSYGLLQSVVLPLLLFPSAFISSFSGLLIPEVSECRVHNDKRRLSRISYRILTISLFFSICVSGIMAFLARDIGVTVYKSFEAGRYIRILAPLIPIMYIDSAVDAILKGMGKQVYSMIVNIIDAGSACLIIFFALPKFGIYGYILSIYVTEILNTVLSLVGMIKCARPHMRAWHQVFLPILCICGATAVANAILHITYHPYSPVFELILHIALVIILYGIFMLLTNAIGKDEKEVLYQSLIAK